MRDLVLGREPHDWDIATNASVDEVEKIFPKILRIGEAFEVCLAVSRILRPFIKVEIARFRKDIGIADGRHPQRVEATSAQEDVKRRDFTINGMLLDPLIEADLSQQIKDWVGGLGDLKSKIIRAIGDPQQRLQEDYLRMLRAIRFAARFQYTIDPELFTAIQQNAANIHKISAERIFDELTKMLTEGNAHIAFELLAESGLLQEILPEALPMKGCEQPPEYHPEGDVWVHTMLLLKQLTPTHDPKLAWGCLLHDIAKPVTFSHEPPDRIRFNRHAQIGADMSKVILKRFKAPNQFTEVVCELVHDHLKFADVKQMRASKLKRFLRNPNFHLHLEQHRIDCMASHENLELYEFCREQLKSLAQEDLQPKPLLSGRDLIEAGYQPGPEFKQILNAIETEQLEGRLDTKKKAIDWVLQAFKKLKHPTH